MMSDIAPGKFARLLAEFLKTKEDELIVRQGIDIVLDDDTLAMYIKEYLTLQDEH